MRRISYPGGISLSARRPLTLLLAFAGALFAVAPAVASGGPHAQAPTDQILVPLAARGDVLSARPDALMQPLSVPTDPSWSQEWDMFAPFSGNYGIDLPGARDITLGSPSITIGVIDTGYRPHVDLTGRFVGGYDFIGDTLVANDGNGRDSDALDPGDWITIAENASGYFQGCGARNSSWHGTHVSGTIGAVSDNGIG